MNDMKKYLGFAAVLGMLFISGACSKDEQAVGDERFAGGKYPLEFTVSGLEAVATPAKASTRGTVDGDWEGVKNIPIQIGGEVKIYTVNPSADGKTATLTSDDPFYWERADETKVVSAWYSARDDYKNTMPSGKYSVSQTQSLKTFAQDDILWAHQSISFKDRESKALSFHHLLSKLTINLVNSPYLEAHAESEVSVLLTGQYGAWNIQGNFKGEGNDFELNQGTALKRGDITPYRLDNTTNGCYATYEVLVIPQGISDTNKIIQVKVGNATYEWGVTYKWNQLHGNEHYVYNITVKDYDLEVTVNEDIGWDMDEATGNGSVTLP